MEQNKMLKVCAYARVSTKASKQESSLQSQIQYFNDLIDSTPNYINMGVFAEQKSGGNEKERSAFLEMIKQCRFGNIDIIYTKTIARFGRNQIQLLRTLEELTMIGVRVIFEMEGIDTFRDRQTIRTVIKSYFAEYELENDKMATNFGIQRMFEKGIVILNKKHPLFGYKYRKDGRLIIDTKQANVVKEIFDRYCNNERVCDIVRILNDRDIKTSYCKEWKSDTIQRIIKQEKYTGKAYLQKTYCKNGRKVENKGQKAMYVVDDFCPPIISQEQFDKANKIRQSKAKKQTQNNISMQDCFKGKIRCGICGGNYIKLNNGNRVYASGKKEKIIYQCYKTHKTAMRECRNKVQSRKTLEDGFIKAFNSLKEKVKNNEQLSYHSEEQVALEKKIKNLLDKEKLYLLLQAREEMTPLLRDEYDNLLEQLSDLQERKKVIKKNQYINYQKYNADNNEKLLNKLKPLTKFDEDVFSTLIKSIVVMGKNRVLYNFKNGYTADVKIIDYYARNDEIGEVDIYVCI